MNVFTYGTLMFSQVWSRVVQGTYRHSQAHLEGFVRKAVIGAKYPVIYHGRPESRVEGIVYYNVSVDDMNRLDDFEGVYYVRKTVSVTLEDHISTQAEAYILEAQHLHIASDLDWDPELFRSRGLQSFLDHYRGFDHL